MRSDTLNETGFVEDTIGAIERRFTPTARAPAAEHAPDIITSRRNPNVLPARPVRPARIR